MKIGELALKTGCSVQTIRFYEKRGLLVCPNRTASNYRDYTDTHLQQLLFTKRCRSLKLSLDDIQNLFALRDRPDGNCKSVTKLVDQHLAEVESQIAELNLLKRQLSELRVLCSDTKTVSQCGILKTLDSNSDT